MKVQRVSNSKEKFKPYKLTIEISVDSEIEQKVLYELRSRADELFLVDGDCGDMGALNNQELKISEDLIKNILSNL